MREQIENEAGMKKQSPEHVRMYAEPSEMYCRRLAEVAFAMYAGKIVASDTGSVETNPSSCQAVFKRMLRVEDQGAGIGLLTKALLEDAKLQQYLAVLTDYVPSKWLLEQERSAKKEWDGKGDIFEAVAERGLLGVSMSGGGIRSATFNLGVLQALAQLGMLPRIDYLSSVSGGGYIHQFLGGWLLRDPNGQDGVIRKMVPQAEPGCLPRSPEPIKWLVRYASYLTPKRGWFTADTWTLVSIWVRNTVLNQIPIVTGFAAAFFFLHLLLPVSIFGRSTSGTGSDGGSGLERLAMWGIVALAAAIFSLGMLGMNLYRQLRIGDEGDGSVAKHEEANRKRAAKLLTNAGVQWGIIVPWLGCALWVTFWAQLHREDIWGHTAPLVLSCGMVLVLVMMVIALGGSWGAFLKLHTGPRGSAPSMGLRVLAIMGFVLIGCLTTGTACLLGWGFVEGSRHLALWLSHVSWLEVVDRGMAVVGKILKALVPKAAEMATSLREGATNGPSASQQHPGTHVPLSIDPWRIQLMILPPALLSIPYVAVELTLGLLGRDFSDTRREWLARLRAWSLLFGVMWAGVVALALLGPYAVYFLIGTGVVGTSSTLIAFVVTHLTAIFASWSGKGDGKPTDKGILGFKPVDFVALIAGPIAMASMLIVVSFAVSLEADALTILLKALDARLGHYWLALLIGGIVNLVVMGMFAWRVDINEFSMISFYRNRLTRRYLGATLNNRQPDPFTGFDDRTKVSRRKLPDQTIPPRVRDMLPKGYAALGVNEKGEREEGLYEGPFPIFCTTLNLTTGKELATQERKGASFTFTPLYSGYSVSWTQGKHGEVSLNGFVPTEEYAYREKGIHVDTAVAVSGAAVNPNMGYNSNPVLAFLMTFFNVRLGWWITNPRRRKDWRATSGRPTPNFPGYWLLHELFGSVDDASQYVNLSDGGHFDNMGLYELVRRRCKYIIVSDAEADPEMKFEGMGTAIAKCRMDFGVEIDLDLRPLRIGADGYSGAHCVVGTIQYPPPKEETGDYGANGPRGCECLQEAGDDKYTGILLYMKTSLVGDEPADLMAYKLRHDVFPHDMTGNQWFTETQFESYRCLGHHVAMTAIQPALSPRETRLPSGAGREQSAFEIDALFHRMYSIWYPRTPEMEKHLSEHLKGFEGILADLRARPELAGLEAALNDPRPTSEVTLVNWTAPSSATMTAEASRAYALQFAHSMLGFMYTVYTTLELAFPDNRVSPHADWWMCLFRRWCRVGLVQDAWVQHVPMFPTEFRLFARRELRLPPRGTYVE